MSSYISQNVHRTMKVLASISSALRTFPMGVYQTPQIGCFLLFPKHSILVAAISQLVKKLQQWSSDEVIEDILPFVLNTKRPLSDIWLLRYKQNNFGCFRKKLKFYFFRKHPKLFCLYLSNQILLRGCFVFKTNGRTSSIISHKYHCCSFFTS